MEVVYIDVLAAINFAVDFLLLLATARLAGAYARRARLLAGAAAGAAYAVLTAFPIPGVLLWPPVRLAVGLGMVRLAFGPQGRTALGKRFLLFLLVSFGFAGCTVALYLMTGTRLGHGGVYYFDVPFRVVAAACAISYVLSGLLFRGAAKHGAAHQTAEQVEIGLEGRRERFSLLYDTGNDLSDPLTGRPVVVLERRAAARLLPQELLFVCTGLADGDCAGLLPRIPEPWRGRFRLLPYRSLGNAGGMLLMLRPDTVQRQGGARYDAYVAITPDRIANGRYEGLIGV
ncbi:sigma-E processing peptidase SpoIIGA [Intestinibacillus massiliensis]|nr:sigma-E processing peptidase SpoIIGA [Intestinibacillus massiliensis]